MNILLVATEAFPYQKDSDLAYDVYGLAQALRSRNYDARIAIPYYRYSSDPVSSPNLQITLPIPLGEYNRQARILFPENDPPTYLIAQEFYFGRNDVYGYSDDYERFIFFSRAVLELLASTEFQEHEHWIPDIIQGYDWSTSLIPCWLGHYPTLRETHFILYIHNTHKLGKSSSRSLSLAGLSEAGIYPQIGETNNRVSLLGRGILFADRILASNRFDRGEPYPSRNAELGQILNMRANDWSSLPQAISFNIYDPRTDQKIFEKYSEDTIAQSRFKNKLKLQEGLGMKVDANIPLVGIIQRHPPKRNALDELLQCLSQDEATQAVVLLNSDDLNWRQLSETQQNIKTRFGFDERLERQIYSACDIFVTVEPETSSAISHLIAMHYGAVPVVCEGGNNSPTVLPYKPGVPIESQATSGAGIGFTFRPDVPGGLVEAVLAAISLHQTDHFTWNELQHYNMQANLSWSRLALQVIKDYQAAAQVVHRQIQGKKRPFDPETMLFEALLEIDGLPGLADRKDDEMLKQAARLVREMLQCDAVYVWGIGRNFQLTAAEAASAQINFIKASLSPSRQKEPPDTTKVAELVSWGVSSGWQQFTDVDRDGLCQPINLLNQSPFAVSQGWVLGRSVPVTAHSRQLGRIDVFFTQEQIVDLSEKLRRVPQVAEPGYPVAKGMAALDLEAVDQFNIAWLDKALTALANSIGLRMESIRIAKEADSISEIGRELSGCQSIDDVYGKVAKQATKWLNAQAIWFYLAQGDRLAPAVESPPAQAALEDARQLQANKDLIYFPDWNDAPRGSDHRRQYRSLMLAPMLLKDASERSELVGVLAVAHELPASFNRDDEHLLKKHLAIQAAAALKKAIQIKQNDAHRIQQLERLASILVGVEGFDQLLQRIIETTADVLQAKAASLYLLCADEPRTLEIRAGAGYHRPLLDAAPPLRYRFNEGVTGTIAERGEVFVANSIDQLHAYNHAGKYKHLQNNYEPNVFLGIPLKIADQVVGVLKLEDREGPPAQSHFSEEDKNLGMMMASVVAAVVYNHERDAQSLKEFSRKLSDLSNALAGKEDRQDKQALMKNIVHAFTSVLQADAASLYLWDEDSQRLVIQAASGYQQPLVDEKAWYAWGEGVTGRIAKDNKSFRANSLKALRDKGQARRGKFDYLHVDGKQPNSFYSTPLNVSGSDRPIGVLKVESLKDNFFPYESELLIDLMANVIAAVVYNYELGESGLQEYSQKLKPLSEALAGNKDQSELMQNIVYTITNVLQADAASLYLWDEDSQRLTIRAASGYQQPLVDGKAWYDWGVGVTGRIAKDNKSFRANSLKALRDKGQAGRGKYDHLHIDGKQPNSFYGTPLNVPGPGRPIGVLKVESLQDNFFPAESELLIDMMANVVATVIFNSQQGYEQLHKFSSNLGKLSGALAGGQDQDSLLDEIVRIISEVMNLDAVSLYLADDKHERLICRAAAGYQKPLKAAQAFYFWGDGVTGKIAQENEKFFAPTLSLLREKGKAKRGKYDHLQGGKQPSSFYGIPLAAGEGQKPIGVLKAESLLPRFFTPEDELLFELMGQIITTVVYNSQQDMKRLVKIVQGLGSLQFPVENASKTILDRLIHEQTSRDLELVATSLAGSFGSDRLRALEEAILLWRSKAQPSLYGYLASAAQSVGVQRLFSRFDRAIHSQAIYPERMETVFRATYHWDEMERSCQGQGNFIQAAETFMNITASSLSSAVLQRASYGKWQAFWLDTTQAFSNPRLPNRLLIIFHTKGFFKLDELDYSELTGRIQQTGNHDIIVIPFIGAPELFELVQAELRTHFTAWSIDTVLLDIDAFQDVVGSLLPNRQLQRSILPQADLKIYSPYTDYGATNEKVFFGREDEKRHIKEHARSQSFAILGGRRFGKSSLLQRLAFDILPRPDLGYRTVHISCEGITDLQAFTRGTQLQWNPDPPRGAPKTVEELLSAPPVDKVPTVFLMDETDYLVNLDQTNGWQLFKTLRRFSNNRYGQVVCSGSYALDRALWMTTGQDDSPFHNFFHKIFYLGPLERVEVTELVVQPMEELLGVTFEDSDDAIQQIYAVTCGQPCIIQRLCNKLIKALDKQGARKISSVMIRDLLTNHDFLVNDYLNTVFIGLKPIEKMILIWMVKEDIFDFDKITACMVRDCGKEEPEAIQAALNWLIKLHSILEKSPGDQYSFRMQSLPSILDEKLNLSTDLQPVIREYLEEKEKSGGL